ncbi:MAG: hypothetical protein ACRD88_00475, partial [Terriglobia bacterium]
MRTGRLGMIVMAGLAVALTACAPGAPGASREQSAAAPSGSKILRIGLTADAEPKEGGIAYGGGGAGGSESMWMLHGSLTNYDESGNLQPRLAERVPTVENGDWVVLP